MSSLGLQIAYNIDIVKSNVPEALEILADAVLNPRFTPWEVAEQIVKMEHDIKGLKENPQTILLEVTPTPCRIRSICALSCSAALGSCKGCNHYSIATEAYNGPLCQTPYVACSACLQCKS